MKVRVVDYDYSGVVFRKYDGYTKRYDPEVTITLALENKKKMRLDIYESIKYGMSGSFTKTVAIKVCKELMSLGEMEAGDISVHIKRIITKHKW